jgi:hypothetical protein
VIWKERQSLWLFRGSVIISTREQSKIISKPSLKKFGRIFILLTDGVVNSQNILSLAIRKPLSVISNGTLANEVMKQENAPCKALSHLFIFFLIIFRVSGSENQY